jgi:hypothetical protein
MPRCANNQLNDMELFLQMKNRNVVEFDEENKFDFALLVDIMQHINDLNLKQEGRGLFHCCGMKHFRCVLATSSYAGSRVTFFICSVSCL